MPGGTSHLWWDDSPDENVYMEITGRNDIGADIRSPASARGGAGTPGYTLVAGLKPGDVVLHYSSGQGAIVAASLVTGLPEPAPIYWLARGSYARRSGERPRWLDGTRVALGRPRVIDPPVTLAEIRSQQTALLSIQAEIEERAGGQPIYFPWVPYGQGPIRTFQTYLAKVPVAVVDLFPSLRSAVQELGEPDTGELPDPATCLQDEVSAAAGRTAARRRGQGYLADQALRSAVETHAMNAATDYFAASWAVEDVHAQESFDLCCRNGDITKHVEVKGTTSQGTQIILTYNEVRHAQGPDNVALFVLYDIRVTRKSDGSVTAEGGTPIVFDPWSPEPNDLRPVGYRYTIPCGGESDAPDLTPASEREAL